MATGACCIRDTLDRNRSKTGRRLAPQTSSFDILCELKKIMIRSEPEEIECFPLVLIVHVLWIFKIIWTLPYSKIDCADIQSGYFEYSEIRFGRASEYSDECFRKWDDRSGSRNFFESYVTIKLRHHPGRRVIFTPLSSDKQNKKILDPGLQSRTHWQTAKVPQVSLRHGCGQIRAAKMWRRGSDLYFQELK